MLTRWLGLAAAGVMGCGTDAVGVSECRAIERARCEAAVACGFPDAAECQRLQRDQCLHGVAAESVGAVAVDGCVRELQRAGSCAAATGPDSPAATCAPPIATDLPERTACDVVLRPELAVSCAFLAPSAAEPVSAAPAGDGGA